MPQTISVSPAQPDKVVINGVDLLNQEELSESQKRELQRYIDSHSHLLGFMDKDKDDKEENDNNAAKVTSQYHSYNSYSLDYPRHTSATTPGGHDYDQTQSLARSTQSLGRVHSPAASDYSGKRKGVSWSDGVNEVPRARSHSPKRESEQRTNSQFGMNGNASPYVGAQNGHAPQHRVYSPAYSTSDRRRTPYDYDPTQDGAYSPWGDTWSRTSRDSLHGGRDSAAGWKGFSRKDIPEYSSLERKPDDYYPWLTHRQREEKLRQSQERDDTIKFYGYGDHKVSGIEMKAKKWTGGEVVTDPTIMRKSLKPRRMFYSPIGDGVVDADGIEMKRGPPDLNPRVQVIHERYVERDPGHAGRRVTETLWDEGNRGKDDDGDRGLRSLPPNGLGDNGLGNRGKPDDDGGKRGPPYDDDGGNRGPPYDDGRGRSPYRGDLDSGPKMSRPTSAMSDGRPREGWTKEFITNPRELIHQYANETPTNIFDLEDHTPRTITTIKETLVEDTQRE
ncbi:CBR-GEI-15 protein [Ditylenchus destructor]|nr:CBR-GEI-15 protein [Ditylenchus destructor]